MGSGCCTSRQKENRLGGDYPEVEQLIYRHECELGFQSVFFERFYGALKRFGFSGDLNDRQLEKIAPDINLKYMKMVNETSSAAHITFFDSEFFTDYHTTVNKKAMIAEKNKFHSELKNDPHDDQQKG